jgi:hypothetical protein
MKPDPSAIGDRYDVPVIAPVPEHTRYYEAGALRVGVEYRLLNDDVMDGSSEIDDPEVAARIAEIRNAMTFDDRGVSFHVCDAGSGVEYLRFDMFEDGPHYHYLHPDEDYHVVVIYDTFACGPMFDWTITCLESRLPAMLRHAGQEELADRISQADVDELIPQLVDAAQAAVTLTPQTLHSS